MRKLLISTTALSVAFSPIGTIPGFAQTVAEDGSVIGPDGAVLCLPTAEEPCDLAAITKTLQDEAAAAAQAEADAAAQAAADAEAAAQAAAEAEAAAQAEAAAAAEAQAAADAEAAAQAEADAAAQAEADAAAKAAAEAAAAAQAEADAAAQAAAEAEAAAQAEAAAAAEAQAAADAEAAAAAEAQAAADAEAAAQAEAEAAAQAEADAAAAAEAAAAESVAEEVLPADETPAVEDAPVVEEAPVEEEAPAIEEAPAAEEAPVVDEAPVVEEAPAEEAPAEEAPAEEAPVVDEAPETQEAPAVEEAPATEEAPAVEEAPALEGSPEASAGAEAEVIVEADRNALVEGAAGQLPEATTDTELQALGEGAVDPATGAPLDAEAAAAAAAALAAATAEIEISDTGEIIDPAAGLKVAEPQPVDITEAVDAPVISATEVESLTQLLTVEPTAVDPESIAAAAVAVLPATEEGAAPVSPADPGALISAVTQTIAPESVRTSAEEFVAAPVAVAEGKKSGLSNLEKAGLVVLGALAVGSIIKSNNERQTERRVVSNTGDRVVMLLPDGSYQVLKDDDAVIRQPGSTVRTETFRDGSTRTIVERTDGTQVVSIRDATGRVLRRASYDDRGREIVLIDDLRREEVVIVEDLPRPRERIVISSKDNDAALKRELAAIQAERAGRTFSLRQIRDIPQVRALAATIDVEPVTFASGSAAIAASEARSLADLGRVVQYLLDLNPAEVFLIEGHTDATGRAALNLALSDRRAESVALALTEYFDIPPENMVVQGYGETELLIDTQASEPANRRVEVRVVTPLMRTAQLR
jgi:outer membrane protein OmpA-like peptidoglycan-associated protein